VYRTGSFMSHNHKLKVNISTIQFINVRKTTNKCSIKVYKIMIRIIEKHVSINLTRVAKRGINY